MAVNFKRLDWITRERQWEVIRDCYAGQHRIKQRRDTYLPRPNPADDSEENNARYQSYLTRAIFYNVVARTLNGLVGLLFTRDPIYYLPDELMPILQNADGSGADVIQLAKSTCRYVVGYGRAGLFIDYPSGDTPASLAEIAANQPTPTIRVYAPWHIINWRTVFRNGQEILSLVVLEETYTKTDDGFVVSFGKQWRVLRLEGIQPGETIDLANPAPGHDPNDIAFGGVYMVQVYRDIDLSTNSPFQTFRPTDSEGNRYTSIPFTFIGSENNKAPSNEAALEIKTPESSNDPPLYDMAELNVGHYRNSADYEESVFIVGQPTPYFSGLTEQWVNNVLKNKIQLGARAAVPLPVNATAGLLQANPNSLAMEAMQHKEKQMVAIGANLIDTSKAPRTATETLIDDNNERSVLATAGDNVSDAFGFAFTWCCKYLGVEVPDSPGIQFVINTDFDLVQLTPQERQELVLEWQSQAITWSEMRASMKRGGVATLDDDVARAEIKANPPPQPATPIAAKLPPNPNPNSNTGGA